MHNLLRTTLTLLAATLLAACATPPAEPPQTPATLRISNVTVIDPETRQVLPSRSVYLAGNRILAIVPERGRQPHSAARTIDGTGKFLIPGLMDMHVHLFLPQPAEPTMALMLANGITSIREMSGDCWEAAGETQGCIGEYQQVSRRVAAGEIPGPDIVSLAGTMVMGAARVQIPPELPAWIAPATPEQGREAVRYLQGRGIDLIKTHDSISGTVFRAMMDEARTRGIEVSGHVPYATDTDELTRLGFGSLEHARDLLYDCSRYGPEFRRTGAAYADRAPGAARPDDATRMRRTVAEFDPDMCRARLGRLAAARLFYTPTHVTREMEARAADPAYRAEIQRRYIPAARNANWQADLDESAAAPADIQALRIAFYRHGLHITGLAHRAGLPIMAGTDANDTMIVPGFALHRELGLLVEAGLSPMDALRAATTVPAAYLRRTGTHGGIAVGKEADLVLLSANPLEAIGNTTRIEAVIANGNLYDRAALLALLASAVRP